MKTYFLLICLMIVSFHLFAQENKGMIADVKVTTDTSIDCSSLQSIAKDIFKDCRTEEEKAIATWYFVRRMMYHWPKVPTWDSLDLINSYGWGLCGYQSYAFARIANAGSLKARTMGAKGHVIAEAWYDNAWHMYDCQVGWFAYRKDKSAVASLAEMKADNTIITEAVKDGRASKPWFQCSDKHGVGITTANTHRVGKVPPVPKTRIIINLRKGESIKRIWGNEGKSWFPKGQEKWSKPKHGCTRQHTDANDPVNWPFWKPYAQIRKKTETKILYGVKRYFGNGRLTYEPNICSKEFLAGVSKENIQAKESLQPKEVGKPASVSFDITCPYIMVDAWFDLKGLRKTNEDVLAVYAKGGKGDWQEVFRAEQTGEVKQETISLKKAAWASKKYSVKIELKAGSNRENAALAGLKVTTVFMNNMYALPYFKPGKNVITVTAGEGADLTSNKLFLEYVWEEEGKEKKLTLDIDKTPFEHTVEVRGKELPRMKYVELTVKP